MAGCKVQPDTSNLFDPTLNGRSNNLICASNNQILVNSKIGIQKYDTNGFYLTTINIYPAFSNLLTADTTLLCISATRVELWRNDFQKYIGLLDINQTGNSSFKNITESFYLDTFLCLTRFENYRNKTSIYFYTLNGKNTNKIELDRISAHPINYTTAINDSILLTIDNNINLINIYQLNQAPTILSANFTLPISTYKYARVIGNRIYLVADNNVYISQIQNNQLTLLETIW